MKDIEKTARELSEDILDKVSGGTDSDGGKEHEFNFDKPINELEFYDEGR